LKELFDIKTRTKVLYYLIAIVLFRNKTIDIQLSLRDVISCKL